MLASNIELEGDGGPIFLLATLATRMCNLWNGRHMSQYADWMSKIRKLDGVEEKQIHQ
jgi:hypothetical protein